MEDLELNVSLKIDSPKVKADTAEAKASIEGIGNSADATAKRVEASMQRISVLDQSSLDHLKKIREEKAAMYAESEKSLQKSSEAAKNNLKNSADEVANLKKTTEQVTNLNKVKAESNKETKANADATESAAGSMIGWISVITTVIGLLYTYREAIASWIDGLLNSKKANEELQASIKATSDALASSEYQNATKVVAELTQEVLDAKNGFIDKTKVVTHYNETMGKAAGVVATLDEVQSMLTQNGDAYIQNVLNQATANLVLEDAIKKAAEAEQRKINGPTFSDKVKGVFAVASAFTFGKTNDLTYADYYNQQLNRSKNADINKLEQGSKTGLEAYRKRKAEADAFAKENNLNVFNDDKAVRDKRKVTDATINERKNLIKQLEQIDAEYARKSFTKDAEELQALKDKFAKMRGVVLDFNKANPKKAISLVEFNQTENTATNDLKYRQDTNKLKTSLDEQKQLYAEYENYKTTFGVAKAKERFGNEVKTNQDLIKQLAVQQAAIIAVGAVGGNKLSGGQQERLLLLQKETKEIISLEQKKNDALLKEFQTYAQKRMVIMENALAEANRLRALGNEAAAQQAIDEGVDQVSSLDVTNAKKWGSYKKLFDNLERMSKNQTLIAIAEFQKELNAANITSEARIDLQNKIDKLNKTVSKGSGKDIQDVANALGRVASEFNNINGNIGNIASVLMQAAQSYVQVKKGIEDYGKTDKGDTLGKVSAGLGIAGAAIGVATAVFGYFKGLKEAKEKALKALKDYQDAAIKGELEYQSLLRKRESDEVRRGKNTYQAIIAQLDLLKKQSPAITAAYEKIFAALQGESSISGKGYQNGTWFRKAKTWDIMASLAGSEYADLEKLYLQGKLKDKAKSDFESLKSLREELQAAGLDVEALQTQLSELLTGTTVGGLADGLKNLFENGKFAAEDFGKSFTEIMRNALTNTFKYKYLEDQLQPFYSALADLMKKGTPTKDEIDALKKQFENIGVAGAEYWKQLESISGINLGNPNASASNSSLSGAIRKELTEDGASILTGVTRNSNEFLRQILAIGKENQTIFQDHSKSLLAIATNTFNSVEELKKVNTELASIKENTAPKLIPR